MSLPEWFTVDPEGLKKLIARRGKAWVLFELTQNSWDAEGVTEVEIVLEKQASGWGQIKVTDNSTTGFTRISDSYTMYAESEKKGKPTKRGLFNLGEKLVLSLCQEALITTTTGTVHFSRDGRHRSWEKTPRGSIFAGRFRLNQSEYEDIVKGFKTLIAPKGIKTTFNGIVLPSRTPLATIQAKLVTPLPDEEGNIYYSERETNVEIYDPLAGESPSVYEMGIPVISTGDRWHYNVMQKVPQNWLRDNVRPSYLSKLRAMVLNNMHEQLTQKDTEQIWVTQAADDRHSTPEAVRTVVELEFGKDAVAADPSDTEATKRAAYEGRTVVHGGSLTAKIWEKVRASGALPPAGRVFPSPKPYSPDGTPLELIPVSDWTEAMYDMVRYAHRMAQHVLQVKSITVQIANDSQWPFLATCGPGVLTLNLGRLGREWFETGPCEAADQLLIHEFGHHIHETHDHLDPAYHEQLCRIGARMKSFEG